MPNTTILLDHQNEQYNFTVTIAQDSILELSERFYVDLRLVSSNPLVTVMPNRATVEIIDDGSKYNRYFNGHSIIYPLLQKLQ